MYLAYNTNGFAHHRLDDALRVLADLGYRGVALTPDVPHLDLATSGPAEWELLRRRLEDLGLACVVETGGRHVLDPWRKHWPNLVTRDPAAAERRVDYYRKACALAAALGAAVVSLWSGALEEGVGAEEGWRLLLERLPRVLDAAAEQGVAVALEPEPGMLVAGLAEYRELRRRLARADLWTTLDSGHLLVTESGPAHQHLAEFAESLRNVQLDDARRGVHEHLPPGEGELDFPAFLAELRHLGYRGPLALELSRDSHRAVDAARAAIQELAPLL